MSKMLRFFKFGWLLNKGVLRGLLWFTCVVLVGLAVNMVGVGITGDIEQWRDWLIRYAPVFLLWRLMLYVTLIYGWLWMRKRLIAREESAGQNKKQVQQRLLVSEICAVATIVVMEVSNWVA